MRARSVAATARLLRAGLDALLVVLVAVVLVQARHSSAALATGIAFAALFAVGRLTIRPGDRPVSAERGRWWPDGAWVAGLVLLWLGLLVTAGTPAIWLAFPLGLLQLHVLGPRVGLAGIPVTTGAAVATGLALGLSPVGAVLGPVLGALLSVAVVFGLEAVLRESEQRQALIDDLRATRQQLADAEHERGVAAERERLAREIHDTLAQGFSSIELLLRVASETGDLERVEQARRVALDNLAEVRRVVRGLAPADLVGATLTDAMARVLDRVRAEGVRTSWSVVGDARELPVDTSAALVRIAQSALANVTRHARATRVDLTLTFLEDVVLLDVVDDGVGFVPGQEGFGLSVLRARAVERGGRVTIESAPGRGTAVAVEVPA